MNDGYVIGPLVSALREEAELSQEELSDGICSTVTLSRLETKSQMPSKEKFDRLMQSLGVEPERFFTKATTMAEYEKNQLRGDIVSSIRLKDYVAAKKQLGSYEEYKLTNIDRQFVLRQQISIEAEQTSDLAPLIERLQDVIGMTVRDFSVETIGRRAMSREEIKMCNALATLYHRDGQAELAIDILQKLRTLLNKPYYEKREKYQTFIIVTYNLSKYVGLAGWHEECIALCDEGIEACRQSNRISALSALIFNKAYSLEEMGRREESFPLFIQSYFTNKAFGDEHHARITEDYILKLFGVDVKKLTLLR